MFSEMQIENIIIMPGIINQYKLMCRENSGGCTYNNKLKFEVFVIIVQVN